MVKEYKRTILTVLCLILIVVGTMTARHISGPGLLQGEEQKGWRLRYEVKVRSDKPEKLHVSLPDDSETVRIHRDSFWRSGLTMNVGRNREAGNRSAVLITRGDGQWATFIAEFDLRLGKASAKHLPRKAKLPSGVQQRYLQSETKVQVGSPAVNEAMASLPRSERIIERAQQILEHCWLSLATDHKRGWPDAAGALANGIATESGRVRAMVAMCRTAGIPSRMVTGFILNKETSMQPTFWVEAYIEKAWIPYDPVRGYSRFLTLNHLPVCNRNAEIVRAQTGAAAHSIYSAEELTDEDVIAVPGSPAGFEILNLVRLPIGMRTTLAVLLLLPVGSLITAIWRNVVGIATFGTFTPPLLALSFLYSDIVTGIVVFALVLTIGLSVRTLLDRLKLLLVPRLSVILTVVVLCLVMAVSILDYLGLTPSVKAVIFPMVIMTMLVERFHVCREEDGVKTAWKLLSGTVAVAVCCLLILRWKTLGLIFISFPELELLVVSALLLIGRYSGYRLSELIRFRDLALSNGTRSPKA